MASHTRGIRGIINMTFDCTKFKNQNDWLVWGSKGDLVSQLQTDLKTLGYYKARVDTDFGNVTYNALKSFQKSVGFTGRDLDGKFGPKTCAKLNEKINAGTNTTSTTNKTTKKDGKTAKEEYAFKCENIYLKSGSTGEQVKQLQTYLKELGFYKATLGTSYDDNTANAVKAYQAWWNQKNPKPAIAPLAEDGEFGKVTCGKLKETLEAKANSEKKSTAKNKKKKSTVKEIVIDAKKYNYLEAKDANFTIEGLHFIITDVTETNGYKVAPWKSVEMMANNFHRYKGHRQPLEYSLTCYLHMEDYDRMKNAIILLQEKERCKVVSGLVESGSYYVDVTRSIDLRTNYKLVFHITEVM